MKQFSRKKLFSKKRYGILLVGLVLAFWSFKTIDMLGWEPSTSVSDVLKAFGEQPKDHYISVLDEKKVQMGENLVKKGYTTIEGKKTKLISKFYKCTACHNTVKEDPDLRYSDPEARLEYAVKNDIPFLQGTTFYGTVNRESWYNGDYYKKYGDLVVPARKSLRGAIQLCAEVCSQGRRLEKWEEDAIVSYFWTIDLKLEDLQLSKVDFQKINSAKREKNDSIINLIKSHYLTYSPATFLEPNTIQNKSISGDPKLGEHVYTTSCLNCHGPNGPAEYLKLGKDKLSYKFLKRKTQKGSPFSLYNITRKGTYPIAGHKPYMPHYTKERLSEKQLEDLRAFIYNASNE